MREIILVVFEILSGLTFLGGLYLWKAFNTLKSNSEKGMYDILETIFNKKK